MTLYFLKQAWAEKPCGHLEVSCDLKVSQEGISAVFQITEPSVKAGYSVTNQSVYEDSCAEIFVSLDGCSYYNFEISCIGCILAQHGKSRSQREFLKPELIENIKVSSTLGNKPFGVRNEITSYTLKVEIPKEVFVFGGCTIDPANVTGNIYKCADKSPDPHYMTLFDIESAKPDFHRPESFRKIG